MIAGSFGQKFQNNSPDLFPEVVLSNRFNKNFQLTSSRWASQSYHGAGLVFSTVLKMFNVKQNKTKQQKTNLGLPYFVLKTRVLCVSLAALELTL